MNCMDCGAESYGYGRCTPCRAIYLKDYREKYGFSKEKTKTEKRKCMCCKKNFKSEGKHNRLCERCREKDGSILGRIEEAEVLA